MSDYEVLDERPNHLLLLTDDGTELVPRSPRNELVYQHDLRELLVDEDETWVYHDTDAGITAEIRPDDGDSAYLLLFRVRDDDSDDDEREVSAYVDRHSKLEFVEALEACYTDDGVETVRPLLEFARDLLDTAVDPRAVKPLAKLPQFAPHVEVVSRGWLINDHLLLTYDNEFYHPNTKRTKRDGTVVDDSANKTAYEIHFPRGEGQLELADDWTYLHDSEDAVEFLARALWAVTYAPEEDPTNGGGDDE